MRNIILALSLVLGISACNNGSNADTSKAIQAKWVVNGLTIDRSDTANMAELEKGQEAERYTTLMQQFADLKGKIEFTFTDSTFNYAVPNRSFDGKWYLLRDTVVELRVDGSPEIGYLNIRHLDDKTLHLFDSSINATMILDKIEVLEVE